MHLLVTVTLNPNQFRSHVEPIAALPEVEELTLVADAPGPDMDKLRTVVPPVWLTRVAGRAVAKLLTGLVIAWRERPSWILGYNLVPHALNAVILAKLTGARSYVHVIGGPAEWRGGGYESDNKLLSRLTRPVPIIERILVRFLRAADVVAVMGRRAREDLIELGVRPERIIVLPAAVDPERVRPHNGERRYDVVTASQLISRKRLHELLQAVAMIRDRHPDIRVAIAGRGPLEDALAAEARRLGIADAVDFLGFVADVESVYADGRIFVLPSQREGLSIAMTEAMASGVPVVVTDIGEARDVVVHGDNGFLFEVGDVPAMAEHISALLSDPQLWGRMSAAAVEAVRQTSSPERITAVNRSVLIDAA
jgi:glycosyltransferase involved in cell wall biosynthesis